MNKSILIVDDDGAICQMMYEMITRKFRNVTVDFIKSVEESIDKISMNNYNLVFMDINFGKGNMDGLEALRQIKEIKPEQNVYMMTGYEIKSKMMEIIKNNALGILLKPFKLEKLYDIIENYVVLQ
jgi:DNA-binding NtrC family response regulator